MESYIETKSAIGSDSKPALGVVFNRLKPLQSFYRISILKGVGVQIAASCTVGANVEVSLGFTNGNRGKIQIAEKAELGKGAILDAWGGSISIGENVFVGPYAVIYGHGGVTIGKDTLIATHCRILSSNHTIPDKNTRIRSQPDILLPVNIGEDVWLGAGVTILGGITIGDGCVIGAGAVVNKDLPPDSIAVGVPARVVRTRL